MKSVWLLLLLFLAGCSQLPAIKGDQLVLRFDVGEIMPEPASRTTVVEVVPYQSPVQIKGLFARSEYVILENVTDSPQDITGWNLLSEKGMQSCLLWGELQPGQLLLVWARRSDIEQEGFNCGHENNIWNNSEGDPAVLFNAEGVEVDRRDRRDD